MKEGSLRGVAHQLFIFPAARNPPPDGPNRQGELDRHHRHRVAPGAAGFTRVHGFMGSRVHGFMGCMMTILQIFVHSKEAFWFTCPLIYIPGQIEVDVEGRYVFWRGKGTPRVQFCKVQTEG